MQSSFQKELTNTIKKLSKKVAIKWTFILLRYKLSCYIGTGNVCICGLCMPPPPDLYKSHKTSRQLVSHVLAPLPPLLSFGSATIVTKIRSKSRKFGEGGGQAIGNISQPCLAAIFFMTTFLQARWAWSSSPPLDSLLNVRLISSSRAFSKKTDSNRLDRFL